MRDLAGPLATIVIATTGWGIACQFQIHQRRLDTSARLAEQVEKLSDSRTRRFAIPALVDFADTDLDKVVRNLVILLDDKDPEIRGTCHDALQRISDRVAVLRGVRKELIENPEHSVGLPEALVLLCRSQKTCQGWRAHLGLCKPAEEVCRGFEALGQSFEKDRSPDAKAACALAMGSSGNAEFEPILSTCLGQETNDLDLRRDCAKALGALATQLPSSKKKEVLTKLSIYLHEPDLRPSVLTVFLHHPDLGEALDEEGRRRVVRELLRTLAETELPDQQMSQAAIAVGRIGSEEYVPELASLLGRDGLPEVVVEAVLNAVIRLKRTCGLELVRKKLNRKLQTPRILMWIAYWEGQLARQPCAEPMP